MRTVLVIVIIGLVIWLGLTTISTSRQATQDRQTISELSAKLRAIEDSPSLELQSKCADSAGAFFHHLGMKDDPKAGKGEFESHYNAKLRKCFVLVKTYDYEKNYRIFIQKFVYDAVEGKSYGNVGFAGHEISPAGDCNVLVSDGTEATCNSLEEFEDMMGEYMDVKD
jgi:hypothetical protein